MHIELTGRFQKDALRLSSDQHRQLLSIIPKLPQALKESHAHRGFGVRKLHASGIYEARIGLQLRVIFAVRANLIILHRVGHHSDVQRYLKKL